MVRIYEAILNSRQTYAAVVCENIVEKTVKKTGTKTSYQTAVRRGSLGL